MTKQRSNECNICYENYLNKEVMRCYTCKKIICYHCFMQMINNNDLSYKCPYCRCDDNIHKVLKHISKFSYEFGNVFGHIVEMRSFDLYKQGFEAGRKYGYQSKFYSVPLSTPSSSTSSLTDIIIYEEENIPPLYI